MTKSTEILTLFEQPSLTQKEFAQFEGKSASMVSYYLRRARGSIDEPRFECTGFTAMKISPS